MIAICRACDLDVPGPGEGVDVQADEVERARVWHFYEEHADAWRYLTLVLGRVVPAPAAMPAPAPHKRYGKRPSILPAHLTAVAS